MTKRHVIAFAIAALIPSAALANDIGGTAADPENSQEEQVVYKTEDDIVIDGDLSEWASWGNAIVNPLIGIPKIGRGDPAREEGTEPSDFVVHEPFQTGTWTGPDDQSTSTQFVWKESDDPDQEGLYMGIAVTDDYHGNATASGWNGDAIQMMVTFYDQDAEEHDPGDFALYNFALGGLEEELPAEEPVITKDVEKTFAFFGPPDEYIDAAIVRDTEAKVTFYEFYLGVDALGVDSWEEGTQFGIGMSINDGDAGEGQDGQKGWGGLGAHAIVHGKSPSETALLTLSSDVPPEAMMTGGCEAIAEMRLSGDADGDGSVGFLDFLALANNFGSEGGFEDGDFNCSGSVDFQDFLALANSFGTSQAASSVPEPSSTLLFGFGALMLGLVRRRR